VPKEAEAENQYSLEIQPEKVAVYSALPHLAVQCPVMSLIFDVIK